MNIIARRGRFAASDGTLYRVTILRPAGGQDEDLYYDDLGDDWDDSHADDLDIVGCEIEWEDSPLHEAMQGSTCTLTVVSDRDRRFTDLYTEGRTQHPPRILIERWEYFKPLATPIVPASAEAAPAAPSGLDDSLWESQVVIKYPGFSGETGLARPWLRPDLIPDDVIAHLAGRWVTYWRGMLDPEQYEEPYSAKTDYEVQLVFSDFGRLRRLPYSSLSSDPRQSVSWLLEMAFVSLARLDAVGLNTDLDVELSRDDDGGADTGAFSDHMLYFDERPLLPDEDEAADPDSEPVTWGDAIESLLQPLGLRVTQVHGQAIVYDLPTIAADGVQGAATVRWSSDDQVLGVGPIYRAITVKYDAGGDDTLCEGALDVDHMGATVATYTFPLELHPDGKTSFVLRTHDTCSPAPLILNSDCRTKTAASVTVPGTSQTIQAGTLLIPHYYFDIEPMFGGDDCAGIIAYLCNPSNKISNVPVLGRCIPNAGHTDSAGAYDQLTGPLLSVAPMRFVRTDRCASLKIAVEMLLDARCDPFDGGDKEPDKSLGTFMDQYWNVVHIPCRLWIRGDDGSVWHYANDTDRRGAYYDCRGRGNTPAGWKSGAGGYGEMWLSYYDWDEPTARCGVKGWSVNKPCRGYKCTDPSPLWHKKRGEGEYVPQPPVSGTLHFEIGVGADPRKAGENMRTWWYNTRDNTRAEGTINPYIIHSARWHAYRSVSIEGVDYYGRPTGRRGETESEITYRATLNNDAADTLDLDTVYGSAIDVPVGVHGLYYAPGGDYGSLPIQRIGWNGAYDTIESWLICNLGAQYDGRHTVLEGTVDAAPMTIGLREPSSPQDTIYLCTAKTEDLATGQTEARFTEISSPKYYPSNATT